MFGQKYTFFGQLKVSIVKTNSNKKSIVIHTMGRESEDNSVELLMDVVKFSVEGGLQPCSWRSCHEMNALKRLNKNTSIVQVRIFLNVSSSNSIFGNFT